ncbi:hypothetical protein [Clostridium frigidicarnis]|uniref:Flagellar assembly protein FliH n=1 Tax=Clostridium frigidicarnis TaxID=84698 RepID=A0A1I0VF24_9CLOT|nr:hypothetical protein [Clostridium frigidicarnis]SFA74647.1 flagellar assembly protein FliH [Clostridium frigidicarnis]
MPSFYSNIIKDSSAEKSGRKIITTTYEVKPKKIETLEDEKEKEDTIDDPLRFDPLGQIIIEKAKRDRDELLRKTYEEVETIRSDAYNEAYNMGYEEGKTSGYDDGYKEAYDKNIEKAKEEAGSIIENANNILLSAKAQYENYLKEKKEEILDLSLYIAQLALNKEILRDDAMDEVIFNALEESAKAKTYIIKCSEEYIDHINENVILWKEKLALNNCEVFIIKDNSLEKGNAVIEKNNGKIKVGIDVALENIKKELF